MTYTEVTNQIVDTINEVNTVKSSYTISSTIYKRSFYTRLTRVNELLSALHVGYWRVYTNELKLLHIEYDDGYIAKNLYPCTLFNLFKSGSYEGFKKAFTSSLLGCASTLKGIASVADFVKDVLSMLSIIEALTTKELYEELSQIYNEQLDEVEALDKEIAAISPEMDKYRDKLSELQQLAVQKWFEEIELKPGMRVIMRSSASTTRPFLGTIKTASDKALNVINDRTRSIEICTPSELDKEKTWLLNNAQFRDLSAVTNVSR